jgi:hypothetical protein
VSTHVVPEDDVSELKFFLLRNGRAILKGMTVEGAIHGHSD